MTYLKEVLILCGPSGSGKSTLISHLTKRFPGRFGFSVSHTTRSPRSGEVDGEHYHFVDRSIIDRMRIAGEFLETADVHGNSYGTSFAAIEAVRKAGKVCILDIDVQGVESVKSKLSNAAYFFLSPPSIQVLEQRLRGRGTESEDKIRVRIENARKELAYADRPGFWDAVVVNDDFELCSRNFEDLVQKLFPQIAQEPRLANAI